MTTDHLLGIVRPDPSKLNLQTIVLNIVLATLLIAALHHSLLDRPGWPPRPGLLREAGGNYHDHPHRRPSNGLLFGWFSHSVEAISARADMSDGDAMYFMLARHS
jgi:hypothetical protein